MSEAAQSLESYEPVFVARQPIFTPQVRVWGYELLFRHGSQARTAEFVDGDVATARVIADGYALVREGIASSRKLLVNFTAKAILEDAARALPSDRVVIEILETVRPDPAIVAACRRLKDEGYVIALDDYLGDRPELRALVEIADIVKVDVLGMSPARMEEVAAGLHAHGCALLAEKVEDRAVFEHARDLGFSLYQGYFFSKPEIVSGRKVTTGELSRLRLLREAAAQCTDVTALARIIASDPGLSHRLLRHLSSAAFGRRGPVRSIRQAALYLGGVALSQWLRVVLVSDLSTKPGSREAAMVAMQRARFLQQLASTTRVRSESADSLFMLGLLSRVDTMLGMPMVEVCGELPLHDRHRAALCGVPSPTRAWLDLVESIERADWPTAMARLDALGVAPEIASRLYADACGWANAMTSAASDAAPS